MHKETAGSLPPNSPAQNEQDDALHRHLLLQPPPPPSIAAAPKIVEMNPYRVPRSIVDAPCGGSGGPAHPQAVAEDAELWGFGRSRFRFLLFRWWLSRGRHRTRSGAHPDVLSCSFAGRSLFCEAPPLRPAECPPALWCGRGEGPRGFVWRWLNSGVESSMREAVCLHSRANIFVRTSWRGTGARSKHCFPVNGRSRILG